MKNIRCGSTSCAGSWSGRRGGVTSSAAAPTSTRRGGRRPRVACHVSTCVFRWLARQDLDRERIILGVEAGPGTNTTLGDQFYACAVGDIGRYNQCKQEFFQNLDLKLERL